MTGDTNDTLQKKDKTLELGPHPLCMFEVRLGRQGLLLNLKRQKGQREVSCQEKVKRLMFEVFPERNCDMVTRSSLVKMNRSSGL